VDILHKLKRFVGTDSEIRFRRNSCYLQFGSPLIIERFRELGIVSNKSKTTRAPAEFTNSPDFWRGCLCADGSVFVNAKQVPVIRLYGTFEICQQFRAFAQQFLKFRAIVLQSRSIWCFTLTHSKAFKLLQVMYPEGCMSLKRKEITARFLLKTYRQWS
jgi:hypothetical protein